MKREDIKTGEIYTYRNEYMVYFFKATENLTYCTVLNVRIKRFDKNECLLNIDFEYVTNSTKEEKEWFKYCEYIGAYIGCEEALELYNSIDWTKLKVNNVTPEKDTPNNVDGVTTKYGILDTRTEKMLYGTRERTILLSSKESATEIADFFFDSKDRYIIVPVKM